MSLLLLGCKQEVLEPEQMIQGKFALDAGGGLTEEYLEFEDGHLTTYVADMYPFAEGKIWHTDGTPFRSSVSETYIIQESNLRTSKGTLNGPIEQKDGVLTVGGKKYSALTGFDANPYSKIVAESEVTFPYTEQDFSIPFSIERPIPAGEADVTTNNSQWLTGLKVGEGVITGHLSATSTDRSGSIKLSYTHATDVLVTVKQAPSTFIRPASESLTVEYAASTQTLGYTIENPVATSTLFPHSSVSWISDIQVSGAQITFKVSENNTGADRNGVITLRYVGAPDVTVSVTQKWSASSITMTPSSQTADYTGGSFNFSFVVTNPRANATVWGTSQANWITNVAVSGNSISYKVAENNSGAQRSGKIKLTYGSYATAEFTVTQSGKPVVSLTLNKSELALSSGVSETLIATVDPTDAPLQWSSDKASVATVDQNGKVTAVGKGTATITVAAGEKTASCKVTVTIPQPDAVDLGLPSGLKWASFNVGASKPEDYGDYYAWGETAPKSDYTWSTYKWCNGSYDSLTRYCPSGKTRHWGGSGNPDNKTSFKDYDYADDAARKVLGGKWRMPTDAEWTELWNNCTWTWTDNYNGTGVKGRVVTATNGNRIFLPAAGYRSDTNLYYAGLTGYYRSSSLDTDVPFCAYLVYFNSDNLFRFREDRYIGQSVRPVYD